MKKPKRRSRAAAVEGKARGVSAKIQLQSDTGEGWGIYDPKDNTWMGNDDGPLLYFDETVAHVAQMVMATQTGRADILKYEIKYFTKGPTTWKDDIPAIMTPLEAIRTIEGFDDGSTV